MHKAEIITACNTHIVMHASHSKCLPFSPEKRAFNTLYRLRRPRALLGPALGAAPGHAWLPTLAFPRLCHHRNRTETGLLQPGPWERQGAEAWRWGQAHSRRGNGPVATAPIPAARAGPSPEATCLTSTRQQVLASGNPLPPRQAPFPAVGRGETPYLPAGNRRRQRGELAARPASRE